MNLKTMIRMSYTTEQRLIRTKIKFLLKFR